MSKGVVIDLKRMFRVGLLSVELRFPWQCGIEHDRKELQKRPQIRPRGFDSVTFRDAAFRWSRDQNVWPIARSARHLATSLCCDGN